MPSRSDERGVAAFTAPPLTAYERSASVLLRFGITAFVVTLFLMHPEAFQAALSALAKRMF